MIASAEDLAALNPGDQIQVWADGHAFADVNEAFTNVDVTALDYNGAAGATFPTAGRIIIKQEGANTREEVDYTGFSGTQFTTLTRGVGGTVASAHAVGADISNHYALWHLEGVMEST